MHRLLLAASLAVVPAAAFGQAHDNIDALIEQQAKANGVPASFVHAVVKRESNYNPRAKGGSALGLMQIKHATARSLGYTGDAAGLLDPATNLRYGVAYLAGAYRTAQGNLSQAYHYYNRGYYYAAKRQGISTEVASVVAPVAASASALASLFGGGAADANAAAAPALAYAPTAASVAAPTETVEVPLPPRRPAALTGTIQFASLTVEPAAAAPVEQAARAETVDVPLPPRRPAGFGAASAAAAELAELRLSPQAEPASAPAPMTPAAASAPVAEAIEVPLPPRRPTIQMLAAAGPRRAPAGASVQEATALPVE
ncbi:transglycosylase SLT domain-containing protein [Methylobacterium sp. J-030]|uniref:lytic transglycosylase domain-containing protein n=1 Tax=Methylobacterium sp. J-030 TaxID=2836627 RepID=UPI001FB897A6|nr:transglycosylase SLT domain-containing protein [Methylobacterium sp. J-030]MCJ2068790.1 transglycosylase SLT domain-containing protein [Methylobacterium sp. J-030]